jgi:hypothetical protein
MIILLRSHDQYEVVYFKFSGVVEDFVENKESKETCAFNGGVGLIIVSRGGFLL